MRRFRPMLTARVALTHLWVLTFGLCMLFLLVNPVPVCADGRDERAQAFPCLLSGRTLSEFWGIPWGAPRSVVQQVVRGIPGVSIDSDTVAFDVNGRPIDLPDVFGPVNRLYYLGQFDTRPVSVVLHFTQRDSLFSSARLDFSADKRFDPRRKKDALYLWRRVCEVLCDTYGYPDDPSPRLIASYRDKSYESYFHSQEEFMTAVWYFDCAPGTGDSLNFGGAVACEFETNDQYYDVSLTYRNIELDRIEREAWMAWLESKVGGPDNRPWWKRMWDFLR